ncbi:MAG: relaxase/mobilization nuclease domain-containing protein [Oscillospiraceae bacterium]
MILKFINGKNTDSSSLKNVLEYVGDKTKTTSELSGGYCCDSEYPYYDMLVTKKLHHKTDGKQYEHYVVSFDPNDDIDAETASNVVSDIVRHYNRNQAFWAVHTNTEHLHAHVVMNSVSSKGDKFRQWKPQLNDFRGYINAICQKYSINTIAKTYGKRPVDDVNLLEVTNEEILNCYGGTQMSTKINNDLYYTFPFGTSSADEWSSYSEQYDDYDYNDYDDVQSLANNTEPVRKNPFVVSPPTVNNVQNEPKKPPSVHNSPENVAKRKSVFFGDSYNIATTSIEKASDFIRSCKKSPGISAAGLKALMNELGDDVEYHLGNEFNIILVDDDENDESGYIDTDSYYID